MRHINIFEAYSAEQAKAVADKAAELLEHYKSLDEVTTANQLMYEVFDMADNTVKPYLSLYFPEEVHEGWIFTNRGGVSYTSIELSAKVNDKVAESLDKKIQRLSSQKEVELVVDYNMMIDSDVAFWQRKSPDFTPEQIGEILEHVENIENVADGVAVLEFDSYYSRPQMSSSRSTPTKLLLVSTDPNYQKWKKFIATKISSKNQIRLRRITFLFKVGVKLVSEEFDAVVPKSVIADFKSFCDDHRLGFESRKRLARMFATAKG